MTGGPAEPDCTRIAQLRTRGGRCEPGFLSVGDPHSCKATAFLGIGRVGARIERIRISFADAGEIGDGSVDALTVACHSPLHASIGAAFADASLPNHLAFRVGIKAVDKSRFLTRKQDVFSVRRSFPMITEAPKS